MKRSNRFHLSYFAVVVHAYDLRTFRDVCRQVRVDPIFAHVVARLGS